MAVFIKIVKTNENADSVQFTFAKDADWENEARVGHISLNKVTGEFDIIKAPTESPNSTIDCVMRKIAQHWLTNVYPEISDFAS